MILKRITYPLCCAAALALSSCQNEAETRSEKAELSSESPIADQGIAAVEGLEFEKAGAPDEPLPSADAPLLVEIDTLAKAELPQTQEEAALLLDQFTLHLQAHGLWFQHQDLGRVWQPSAAAGADWRPYFLGTWIDSDQGWMWSSEEEFGWIVYHYGRWTKDQQRGWLWVPGFEWAPAWVAWSKVEDSHIGWAPLPPENAIGYSDHGAPIIDWGFSGNDHFTFVEVVNFGLPVRNCALPRHIGRRLIPRCHVIPRWRRHHHGIAGLGPERNRLCEIQPSLRNRLNTRRVERVRSAQVGNRPSLSLARNGRVRVRDVARGDQARSELARLRAQGRGNRSSARVRRQVDSPRDREIRPEVRRPDRSAQIDRDRRRTLAAQSRERAQRERVERARQVEEQQESARRRAMATRQRQGEVNRQRAEAARVRAEQQRRAEVDQARERAMVAKRREEVARATRQREVQNQERARRQQAERARTRRNQQTEERQASMRRKAEQERQRAVLAQRQAELEKQRQEQARKAAEARKRSEDKRRQEEVRRKAAEVRQRAEQSRKRAQERMAEQRREAARKKAEQEARRRAEQQREEQARQREAAMREKAEQARRRAEEARRQAQQEAEKRAREKAIEEQRKRAIEEAQKQRRGSGKRGGR